MKASGIRLRIEAGVYLGASLQGLLNNYRCPISTGPLEGTYNNIKTLKRQTYGYRDREFFKLKFMSLHLYEDSLAV